MPVGVLAVAAAAHSSGLNIDELGLGGAALAFGAWHALGATSLNSDNDGLGQVLGQGWRATGAVCATAIAGLGFLAVRRHTDSVVPGIAMHWALNSSSAVAAGIQ